MAACSIFLGSGDPSSVPALSFLLLLLLLLLVLVQPGTHGLYVSYETPPRAYSPGQQVPLIANKLLSSDALEALDYSRLPYCGSMKIRRINKNSSSSTDGSNQQQQDQQFGVFEPIVAATQWQKALSSLHGDALYDVTWLFDLRMLENRYCQQLCLLDPDAANNAGLGYSQAIVQDMHYHLAVDGMPAAFRHETDETVSIRYWGGIPVGRRGPSQEEQEQNPRYSTSDDRDLFLYNHLNFYITYWRVPAAATTDGGGQDEKYRVVKTEIQPLSVGHRFEATNNGTAADAAGAAAGSAALSVPVTLVGNSIPSCDAENRYRKRPHPTLYADLETTPPQLWLEKTVGEVDYSYSSSRPVLFTYDVVWIEFTSTQDPWKTRWNVFLRMDDGIPATAQLFGLVVAVLINAILAVSLYTWMMRDLSYRPLLFAGEDEYDRNDDDPAGLSGQADAGGGALDDGDDERPARSEQERDVQLWPLSTRLFFPPRVSPLGLCLCSGLGAQLLLSAFVFVLLFRTGIVNESMGSDILMPAVVLYTVSSVLGGWVTARWYGLFHGNRLRAFHACGILSVGFPLLGLLVLYLTYDVLVPEAAPEYRVVSNSLPLILVWVLGVVPLTFAGGWCGYVKGPMTNFPVSEGTKGYQDLNVHGSGDHDMEARNACCCWRHARIIVVFFAGGIPPVACSFVEYAYGVAGPIYVGYYSDASFYAILSFVLFCTCVALVACLLFYQQIRARNFEWWWTSFVVGISAGFYLFLLSMSWILYDYLSKEALISGETLASYTIWFAFGSVGASLIAGFVSLGSCMVMTRLLYAFLIRRSTPGDDNNATNEPAHERDEDIVASSRRYNMSSITEADYRL
jgi:hypothetical protein